MAQNILTPTELVLFGGSAGSLEVVIQLLPALKLNGLPAIVIVLHRKAGEDSSLTDLLSAKTKIRVKEAEEKESIKQGTIYIAPADYHLLVEKDHTFSLDYSEKINYSRPSIDVSFESAADAYGPALLAILLSGANDDGAKGMELIASAGGKIAIQDPAEAEVPYMPQKAIERLGAAARLVTGKNIADIMNSL